MFRNTTISEHRFSGRERFPSNLSKLLRSFQNAEKRFNEKEKQLSRSRALAQEKYTKVKTTRMLKFPEPPLKNKISLQPIFAKTVLTELEDFPEKSEKFLVSRKQ